MKTSTKTLQIQGLQLVRGKITIKGTTPYISSRMSEKAKEGMIKGSAGEKGEKKKFYSLDDEYKDFFYLNQKKQYCIPSSAIKKSMVEASVYVFNKIDGGSKRTKGAIHIVDELIPINYKKLVAVDSFVRNPNRIVRRPHFLEWQATFEVEYNAKQISPEQIHTILKLAGFHIGIGAWRPQCGGTYGRFTIT